MKNIAFFICLLASTFLTNAQETYNVDGESLTLQTEVTGTLDLLWNIIDGHYRYFIKKDNDIVELKNTKGANNKFQEEYKITLNEFVKNSALSADKVNLTLYSLRKFIDDYNSQIDSNYSSSFKKASIQTRLLIFGGITNSPFVENPGNVTNPLFGAELELFEANKLPRHSLLFQIKHALNSDEFKYSNTQLGLGYRFRIINLESFNIYANVMAATFNFSNNQFVFEGEIIDESGNNFDVPFIFGIGADIRISESSFITLTYDELFALFLDNQGNFSTHLAIGYKFNL